MIDIKTIPVLKGNGEAGSVTIVNNGGGSGGGSFEPHYLWGQYFDDTQDITGDMTVQGNITADDGNFTYIYAPDGTVVRISGNELSYNSGRFGDLTADNLNAKKATINDLESLKGFIQNLNSNTITTEYLTVTKQAHFFELIIDKIKSVGGQLIMTPANCVADYVKAFNASNVEVDLDSQNAAYYDVFFLAHDASGRSITNDWLVYDQALCQSFNNVSTGVNYNVSNKYYWRLVTSILADRYMNLNTGVEKPLSEASTAAVNVVEISNPRITYTATGVQHTVNTDWNTVAQSSTELDTGVVWNQTTGGAGVQTSGTMKTTNTIFGIKLTPIADSDLANALPETFSVTCGSAARLNIGVNYVDDSYEYFKAPTAAVANYTVQLHTESQIKSVIITNADEVEWKLVHGIRLSNTDCDLNPNADSSYHYSNIPSVGDNIVQLGYRYNMYSQSAAEYDVPRSSAIIVAAYHTPDSGLTPPSYAQYTNIIDYHLSNHRQTYIDANGAKFIGNLYVDANTSVQDLINQSVTTQWYLHIAYADSSDGSVGFAIAGATGQYAPIPGHAYSYMGFLSDTNANASTNYADYEWVEIPGGSGTQGASVAFAYKNYTPTQANPTPQKPPQGTVIDSTHSYNNWTYTASTPDFANGEYTYMTQTYQLAGVYGTWSDPIRITGDNGENGADGKYIEFIYNTYNTIKTWTNTGANGENPEYWNNTSNVDTDGYSFNHADYKGPVDAGWTDNPSGVSENMKYEYVSQRMFDGTNFGTFTEPVIWSSYGEKGQDGDGYEYIYKHFQTEQIWNQDNNNPAYWGATQSEDYLGPTGYEWSDDPVGVTRQYLYEYVSVRKRENGTWGTFSTPTLWSRYASQGANGGRYIFLYQNYTPSNPPSIVPNGSTEYSVSTLMTAGWSGTATTPNFANGEYTYMTQAFFADGDTQAVWTTPIRMTGDNGQNGEDGKYTEFIYKRFASEQTWNQDNNNPAYWAASQTEDYLGPTGYTWNDNPTGITETYKYEYVAEREYNGTSFGQFSTPVIWSKWGEKGQDGDGYEYIYYLALDETSAYAPSIMEHGSDFNVQPYSGTVEYDSGGGVVRWRESPSSTTWHVRQSRDYLPISWIDTMTRYPVTYWTDDPQGVSEGSTCEYVSMRKYNGAQRYWGNFDDPTIWAMYAAEGPTGPQGPTGPSGQNSKVYQLVNNGTVANVDWSYDANNDLVQTFICSLNFKVIKIEGLTARYMTYAELRDFPKVQGSYNGMYAYVKMTKSTGTMDGIYQNSEGYISIYTLKDNTLRITHTDYDKLANSYTLKFNAPTITNNQFTYEDIDKTVAVNAKKDKDLRIEFSDKDGKWNSFNGTYVEVQF